MFLKKKIDEKSTSESKSKCEQNSDLMASYYMPGRKNVWEQMQEQTTWNSYFGKMID